MEPQADHHALQLPDSLLYLVRMVVAADMVQEWFTSPRPAFGGLSPLHQLTHGDVVTVCETVKAIRDAALHINAGVTTGEVPTFEDVVLDVLIARINHPMRALRPLPVSGATKKDRMQAVRAQRVYANLTAISPEVSAKQRADLKARIKAYDGDDVADVAAMSAHDRIAADI